MQSLSVILYHTLAKCTTLFLKFVPYFQEFLSVFNQFCCTDKVIDYSFNQIDYYDKVIDYLHSKKMVCTTLYHTFDNFLGAKYGTLKLLIYNTLLLFSFLNPLKMKIKKIKKKNITIKKL